MKRRFSLLLTMALFFLTNSIYAHALWLETSANGRIGQQQEVNVYYGEYAEHLHEIPGVNFKDELQQFTVWLISPDEKKIKLELTEAKDGYKTAFTPRQEGIYTIILENTSLKVVDTKGNSGLLKPYFYGRTTVTVGKPGNHPAIDKTGEQQSIFIVNENIAPLHPHTPASLKVVFNNQPFEKGSVTIFSPEGWLKEVATDENGQITFTPEWKGRYVVEVVNFSKIPGELNGDKYQSTRTVSTYTFEVR